MLFVSDLICSPLIWYKNQPLLPSSKLIKAQLLLLNCLNLYQQENTCSEHGQCWEHGAMAPCAAGGLSMVLSPPCTLPIPVCPLSFILSLSLVAETGQVMAELAVPHQPNAAVPQSQSPLLTRPCGKQNERPAGTCTGFQIIQDPLGTSRVLGEPLGQVTPK